MEGSLADSPLRPNRPDVIDETFDGEAVLVNLDSGCYYALSPAATVLWNLCEHGRSPNSLVASSDAPAELVESFVAQFIAEGLLVPGEIDAGPAAERAELGGEPTIEKFTDMQQLLMLDPIHDIQLDADGWPVAPNT